MLLCMQPCSAYMCTGMAMRIRLAACLAACPTACSTHQSSSSRVLPPGAEADGERPGCAGELASAGLSRYPARLAVSMLTCATCVRTGAATRAAGALNLDQAWWDPHGVGVGTSYGTSRQDVRGLHAFPSSLIYRHCM